MRRWNFIPVFVCLFMCTALLAPVPSALLAQDTAQEVPHESGLYYTIQKGDTLWDLSRRFFDSPELWPDLWNKNNQIPNPHWIYPGEQIRLYHQEGIERLSEPAKITQQAKPEAIKIEPPQEMQQEPPYYYYAPIETVGFIREEAVKPSGTIFRSQDDKTMISQGDIVYVRPARHTILYKGATYTTYRTLEGTSGQKYGEIAGVPGVQHYLTGVIEIVKPDADYYVARVIRSYRSIRIDDLLMPYRPRSPRIVLAESTEGIAGQILFNEDRDRMFADNATAFIDKGKKDGIEVGQFYSVYYEDVHGLKFYKEENKPSTEKEALETPVDFAKILVLLTEDRSATVLITYSEKDLYPTARIRTPVKSAN